MSDGPHAPHGDDWAAIRRRRRAHHAAFRVLLRLYPAAFRRAYGDEMAELFVRRIDRGARRPGLAVVGLWRRAARDVVRTALAERLGRLAGRTYRGDDDGEGGTMRTLDDIRNAARRLARSPLFTLSAVAIVALGIGANTAAFTVIDAVLFRPPPYGDPERVVNVYQDSDEGDPSSTSFPAYRDMSLYTDVFEGVAASSGATFTWETEAGPRPVRASFVTASYLPVLGLSPSVGRGFAPEHDQVGAGAFAVVSHRLWRSALGEDPGVIGRSLRLNGEPVTIVGVGPEGFSGTGAAAFDDLWLSISSTVVSGPFRVQNLERREDHWYQVVARLAPGVSVPEAQSAMDGLAARMAEAYPELDRGRDITVLAASDVRLHPQVDARLYPAAGILAGVVGLVLLLACSNLANLLLVRGVARAPEMALRRALGASRARVAGLFLTEALLLSALGGAAGLLVARGAVRLVPRLPLPISLPADALFPIDGRVILFTLLLVLATGALFGLAPALRSAREDVAGALREDVRSASPGRRVRLFRNGLVALQVAVSLVLLVGAGLLLRSLGTMTRVDAGVAADRVAFLDTSLPPNGLPGDGDGAASRDGPGPAGTVFDRVAERIRALPGVTGVAMATRVPVLASGGTTTTVVEGYDPPTGTGAVELLYNLVSPEYFDVLGISVLDGRAFTADDGVSSPRVAILSETAARRYFGDRSAVGRRLRPQSAPDAWIEIVGVVGDTRIQSLTEAPTPLLYYPLPVASVGRVWYLARAEGDPSMVATAMRGALREVAPALPVLEVGRLDRRMDATLGPMRVASLVLASFSAFALLLATTGIYAVVSMGVARRSAELGIRIALGAARRRVVAMVLGEVMVTVALGMVAGLAFAVLVAPRLSGFLFGVGGWDAMAFGVGAALLGAVAVAAAWIPARRAATADPVDALRAR